MLQLCRRVGHGCETGLRAVPWDRNVEIGDVKRLPAAAHPLRIEAHDIGAKFDEGFAQPRDQARLISPADADSVRVAATFGVIGGEFEIVHLNLSVHQIGQGAQLRGKLFGAKLRRAFGHRGKLAARPEDGKGRVAKIDAKIEQAARDRRHQPDAVRAEKIKKASGHHAMSLELVENPDIIAAVAARPDRPLAIGFAAETEHVLEHAREKLARKGLDLIVVNDVSDRRIGFDSDDNEVTLVTVDVEHTVPLASKRVVSRAIIERIADLYEQTTSPRSRQGRSARKL